jgi:GTP pyrophosphokinase
MADITTEELEELENEVVSKDDNIKTMQEFVSPESLYQELIASVKKYHPSTDISLIEKAYKTADTAHKGQVRKSGEAYIIHPLCVAIILAELELDKETIVAGLLHDVVEDTVMTVEEIASEFSEEIALLVDGVTKLGQLSYDADKVEVQAENLRKMFLAMAKDIRVILIKLADRLHNMRTLKYMTPEKQKEKARETMDIYAPIAQRLGISKIKIELDDLSLKYLEPEAYYDLVEKVALRKSVRDDYVQSLVKEVSKHIENAGIKAQIDGRAKHFFSIYKKMVNQHKTLDQIYDLFAIRIIVDNVKDCYAALGVIHEMYKPIPGRFKDYIAMPKPNMYQSLHTSVIGEDGNTFEIQIRTEEMDELAELGVAAHWRYKEGKGYSAKDEQKEIGEKLQWLREFISLSDDIKDGDAKEYYDSISRDIFEANVYVLTPQGKIVELPNGSTPVDFAYRIHTEVGHHTVGAIVNNVMVPIDTKLNTGDVCEIKTNKQSAGPSEDWLKFVRTAGARNKIRTFLAKKEAETKKDTIEDGKKILKDEIKKRGLDEKKFLDPETYKTYLGAFGARNLDDILYFIGKKTLSVATLLEKVNPKKAGFFDNLSKILQRNNEQREKLEKTTSNNGVVVKGVSGLKIQLSKCCNPIPGDKITGYVSQGQGIKVHRVDCPNIKQKEIQNRLIDVYWDFASLSNLKFDADLQIDGLDRTNLLNDIITVLGQMKINILNIHADASDDGKALIKLKIGVDDAEHLNRAIANLERIQGIYEIKRVIH